MDMILVMRRIMQIIEETVAECGDRGAPEGIVYLGLNKIGIDLDTYNSIIETMVDAGKLIRKHHVLYKKVS